MGEGREPIEDSLAFRVEGLSLVLSVLDSHSMLLVSSRDIDIDSWDAGGGD